MIGLWSMVVQVFMLGDKLLDRLRSATFAMLGLVTAVGLVLVALVLQQGWPSVFGGPLPAFSNKPPADEIASAVPGSSGGGAASTPQFGVGVAPPRAGSASGGSGLDGSRGQQGPREVAAAAPIASGPGPAPSETAPGSPAAPPPVDTSSPPAPPTAVAPPSAQAAPAASAKEDDGDDDKAVAGAEGKKTSGKDKVAANGRGSSSKGSTAAATAKPKSSGSKPKPPSAKPSPPADKASAEPAPGKPVPPVYEPGNETLPVEEKAEPGSGHGYGRDK